MTTCNEVLFGSSCHKIACARQRWTYRLYISGRFICRNQVYDNLLEARMLFVVSWSSCSKCYCIPESGSRLWLTTPIWYFWGLWQRHWLSVNMSVQSQLDILQASCKKRNHNVVQMRGAASKKEYKGTTRTFPSRQNPRNSHSVFRRDGRHHIIGHWYKLNFCTANNTK